MSETTTSTPDLLTVNEAAAFLRKDRSTIYRFIKEGKITGYRIMGNGYMLFKRDELLSLLVPVEPGTSSEKDEGADEK